MLMLIKVWGKDLKRQVMIEMEGGQAFEYYKSQTIKSQDQILR